MDKVRYQTGLEIRQSLLGEQHVKRSLENADEFNRPFLELVIEFCWGEIWASKGLSRDIRSMINVAIAVALGRTNELPLHFKAAKQNGVSKQQLLEVLFQAEAYCGAGASDEAAAIASLAYGEPI